MSRSDNEKSKGCNPARRALKESSRRKHRNKSKTKCRMVMEGHDPDNIVWENWNDADNIYTGTIE